MEAMHISLHQQANYQEQYLSSLYHLYVQAEKSLYYKHLESKHSTCQYNPSIYDNHV